MFKKEYLINKLHVKCTCLLERNHRLVSFVGLMGSANSDYAHLTPYFLSVGAHDFSIKLSQTCCYFSLGPGCCPM